MDNGTVDIYALCGHLYQYGLMPVDYVINNVQTGQKAICPSMPTPEILKYLSPVCLFGQEFALVLVVAVSADPDNLNDIRILQSSPEIP